MSKLSELKKTDWLYPVFFLGGLSAQLFLLFRTGPHPSTDYLAVYEPAALSLLDWIKGAGEFPSYPGYFFFRSAYILYVSCFHALFSTVEAARTAAVIFQIVLFSAIFPSIYYLLKKNLAYKWPAAAAGFCLILFFDNIQWAAWLLTDHIYKAVFLLSAVYVLDFAAEGKIKKSRVLLFCASAVLLTTRMDSIVLLAPLYWLILKKSDIYGLKLKSCLIVVLAAAAAAYLLRGAIINAFSVVRGFYERGDIIVGLGYQVPGLTRLEAFDSARSADVAYIIRRAAKIFFLRAFHAFNVAPPFWSKSHKIYYAAHMIPLYLLAATGAVRSIKEKNDIFRALTAMTAGAFVLHGLTRIDGALRTMYTPLTIMIMLAAYGADGAVKKYLKKDLI